MGKKGHMFSEVEMTGGSEGVCVKGEGGRVRERERHRRQRYRQENSMSREKF